MRSLNCRHSSQTRDRNDLWIRAHCAAGQYLNIYIFKRAQCPPYVQKEAKVYAQPFKLILSSFLLLSMVITGGKLFCGAFSIFLHVFVDIQWPYQEIGAKLVPRLLLYQHIPAVRPQPLAETGSWKHFIKIYCRILSQFLLFVLIINSKNQLPVSEYKYIYSFEITFILAAHVKLNKSLMRKVTL